jgi:hypothetical protein
MLLPVEGPAGSLPGSAFIQPSQMPAGKVFFTSKQPLWPGAKKLISSAFSVLDAQKNHP